MLRPRTWPGSISVIIPSCCRWVSGSSLDLWLWLVAPRISESLAPLGVRIPARNAKCDRLAADSITSDFQLRSGLVRCDWDWGWGWGWELCSRSHRLRCLSCPSAVPKSTSSGPDRGSQPSRYDSLRSDTRVPISIYHRIPNTKPIQRRENNFCLVPFYLFTFTPTGTRIASESESSECFLSGLSICQKLYIL